MYTSEMARSVGRDYPEDFTGCIVAITGGDTIKVMHYAWPEGIRLVGNRLFRSQQPFGTRRRDWSGGAGDAKRRRGGKGGGCFASGEPLAFA